MFIKYENHQMFEKGKNIYLNQYESTEISTQVDPSTLRTPSQDHYQSTRFRKI